jgi:hypothetical protein
VPTPRSRVANSLLHSLILKTFITVVEMWEKRAFSGPAESLNSACMSTACSFFGGSSGNPACATWWITTPMQLHQNCLKDDYLKWPKVRKRDSHENIRRQGAPFETGFVRFLRWNLLGRRFQCYSQCEVIPNSWTNYFRQ